MNSTAALEELYAALREIATLGSIGAVLGWDEQTYQPSAATQARADQTSLIARLAHERGIAPRLGELIHEVEVSDLKSDPLIAANLREIRRNYDREKKLPTSLVEALSHTAVLSQDAWIKARKASDYSMFKPLLAKTIELKRQEAECYGYVDEPYDALLDTFEPGETSVSVQKIFDAIRGPTVELVRKIVDSKRRAPIEIMERKFPVSLQESFARRAAGEFGYDLSAGRIDVTAHPFCTGISAGDTRITTRFDENNFGDAFFSVLHETGHALYEQGLPKTERFGQPLADSVSLGIHESQSRLWENLVGRTRQYWERQFPAAQKHFGPVLDDVSFTDWIFAINDVRPSLIRTEADEVTYNLHVMLRFDLERQLIGGTLSVDDLPATWNQRMNSDFGLTPPNDALGCMQDVHWSAGLFGYFPTYALGNMYSAQFFEKAKVDLGDVEGQMLRGEFGPLLSWLRKNIHQHGKRYRARDLVRVVTGQELSSVPLLDHLKRKASEFYES